MRPAATSDRPAIWNLLAPVIGAGETLALPRGWKSEQALDYWFAPHNSVFVAEHEGQIAGTYYLRANQLGGGSRVANCGYVTGATFGRRGVAKAMCLHSLEIARKRGFGAMQFNFVVGSNAVAVKLWQKLGFQVVGVSPAAFELPSGVYTDALIMHRQL